MGSLSVQGFTLGIIQPISPLYVENKWRGSTSPELLLLLFAKEITLLDKTGHPLTFKNDPDNKAEMRQFRRLVFDLTARLHLDIKLTTVLEPVGPSFAYFATAVTCATVDKDATQTHCLPPGVRGADISGSNRFDGLTQATGQGDAQYHVGNYLDNDPANTTGAPGASATLERNPALRGQMYRVYSSQVALCVEPDKTGPFEVYPTSPAPKPVAAPVKIVAHPKRRPRPAAPPPVAEAESETGLLTELNLPQFAAAAIVKAAPNAKSPAPAPAPGPAGAGGGHAAASGGGATSSSQVTAALQADRISAIIEKAECAPDELVMQPATEAAYAKSTASFAHVRWRSIAEVVQYLGAIARRDDQPPASWYPVREPSVQLEWPPKEWPPATATPSDPKAPCSAVPEDASLTDEQIATCFASGNPSGVSPQILFSMRRDVEPNQSAAYVAVNYGGRTVYIRKYGPETNDHSFEVIQILSELLNTAKNSSDLPITPQLLIP
jgi:hypothetical protein